MSQVRKVGRRNFLIATASGGIGLALGLYLKSKRNEARSGKLAGWSPNAWLQVRPDNTIYIWVSKSEMGQGVRTALPMLVAEELEAEWASIRVVQAPTVSEYFEERTQGSSSVRTMWATLSQAGATAREMLITASAQAWGVDRTTCRPENGQIIHQATGRRMSYGELASAAAKLPVPKDVPLKKPADYRLLGQPVRRLDTPGKTNGSAVFGIDVRLPQMLYAAVLRCPNIGGHAKNYDARRCRSTPGVRDVLETPNGIAVIADSTWSALQGRVAL